MRIGILCPHFPPDPCGVGDHTARLAEALSQQGHDVSVWTGQKNPAPLEMVRVHTETIPWGPKEFSWITLALQQSRIEALLVQYTPYLYGPKTYGIHPAFSAWVGALRLAARIPVVLMAHELHYPIGIRSMDRLLLGNSQLTQFLGIAMAADLTVFTYEAAMRRISRLLRWKRRDFAWLPVGANVEPVEGAPSKEALVHEAGWSGNPRILLQFGSSHASRRFDFSFGALRLARERAGGESAVLAFVGISQEEADRQCQEAGFENLQGSVRGLGYLEPARVTGWMRASDLVLAPFVDGISSRRGSVMAALAHCRPVVSTRGSSTGNEIEWESFTALAAYDEPAEFARAACRLLLDPAEASRLGEAGRDEYVRSFSWPVIARRLVARIEDRIQKRRERARGKSDEKTG